jgi:hypothetical protein
MSVARETVAHPTRFLPIGIDRDSKHRFMRILPYSFLLLFFAACSSVPQSEALNARVSGTWQYSEGDYFPNRAEVGDQYLKLEKDGTGTLYSKHSTGAISCRGLLYGALNDRTLVLTEIDEQDDEQDPKVFTYEKEGDTLTFRSEPEIVTVFSKVDAVASGVECKTFSSAEELPNVDVLATQSTNLVYSSGLLYYVSDETVEIQKYSLSSNELGTPITDPAGHYDLRAYEGGAFWIGSGYTAERIDQTDTVLDTVDVSDLITDSFYYFDSAATDGTNLWTQGYNYTTRSSYLVSVNTDEEPDELGDVFPFDLYIRALTWDGNFLWAVGYMSGGGQGVIKIDSATGKVTASYKVPDPTSNYFGIASDRNDDLYLLSETTDAPFRSRIERVTP